jgi:hypothetical protein
MNAVDQKIAAGKVRRALDTATLEAIKLRKGYDLGDIPLRLHQIRDEIVAIDAQLDKDIKEHFKRNPLW